MAIRGYEEIKAAITKTNRSLVQSTARAGDIIAKLLENSAKAYAPFTDRTANLRNSIKGKSESAFGQTDIYLTAQTHYARSVEYRIKFSYLRPTITREKSKITQIIQRELTL